jgi:hypothetical protein
MVALEAGDLLGTRRGALDDLFRSSQPGEIPTGCWRGTVLVTTGWPTPRPAAALCRALVWRGKVFRPETGDLLNLVGPFEARAVRAAVYRGESWLDRRDCIVLDYSRTSTLAGWIRDEIREVRPRLYLGLVWGIGRMFGGRRRLGAFALHGCSPADRERDLRL